MSGCCSDYRCRRKTPIMLYRADLSGTVYAVTRSRELGRSAEDKTHQAIERHDVTSQMVSFIRANPDWVRAQLPENDGPARYGEPVTEEDAR